MLLYANRAGTVVKRLITAVVFLALMAVITNNLNRGVWTFTGIAIGIGFLLFVSIAFFVLALFIAMKRENDTSHHPRYDRG